MTSRWIGATLLVGALAAGGCSSSGGDLPRAVGVPAVDATTGSTTPASTTSATSTSPPSTSSSTTTSTNPSTTSTTPPEQPTPSIDDVRINELQVLGSHNSYHLAPEGAVKDGLAALVPAFAANLDYTHRPLAEQLGEFGIRQFEIDVFADPDGGRYALRQGPPIVGDPAESGIAELDVPGFKVLHIQDIDFGTTCPTLVACLGEIEAWSAGHPTHVPIHVMIEIKEDTIEQIAEDGEFELPDLGVEWTVPLTTTAELLADLEDEVLSVFDLDRIITPDRVRGDFATLPEAVATDGWPTLGEARGKVMFSLLAPDAAVDLYRAGAPALEDRLFFTHAEPGAPDAAFVRFDDPVTDAAAIADALTAGYLVRTRSDDSSTPDGDPSQRDAALASGAHYVSTDVYDDIGRGFVVALPGGVVVRCNPVTASPLCVDAALRE